MPKKGFRSITIKQKAFDNLTSNYEERKGALELKGINSLSGYVTVLLYAVHDDRNRKLWLEVTKALGI